MKEIGIGILGFGTVGAGVVGGIAENSGLMFKRSGIRLKIRRIADIDVKRDRGVSVPAGLLTTDAASVVDDGAVDIVVELIGGTGAAFDLIERALKAGKPVVTANKALLAERGRELFALAEKHGTNLFFEASVAGGIPLIRSLREGLAANRIRGICGILNGTCNYILTRMESDGLSFDDALGEAQRSGYAEADPSLDIDGKDTAHKAAILASLAYGFNVPMKSVFVAGMRGFDRIDIEYALDLGYRVKMLAIIKARAGAVEIRVHPALVPLEHILASVGGVNNAVMIEGDMVGETLYYGRGAGRAPTASAVLGDIIDAARDLKFGCKRRAPGFTGFKPSLEIMDSGDIVTRYYMRLSLVDKPGVFGRIGCVLGRHKISIASVLQKEKGAGRHAPVVIITHNAVERNVKAALRDIGAMRAVGGRPKVIRIEDFQAAAPG